MQLKEKETAPSHIRLGEHMELDPESPAAQTDFLCKRECMLQFPETTHPEWYPERTLSTTTVVQLLHLLLYIL